jgi:hypothetical protein
MGNQPQASVVSQLYLEHATLHMTPDMRDDFKKSTTDTRPVEYSPGIVANKYELVFLQRNPPTKAAVNPRKQPQKLFIARGSRPQFPMFRPGISLPSLNRHLNWGNKHGGWTLKDIKALGEELIFLGGVDSVGPGESMNPDRVNKNYVIVFKNRFIAWNVWPELELPYRDLYLVLCARVADSQGTLFHLEMKPMAFGSQWDFHVWRKAQHSRFETALADEKQAETQLDQMNQALQTALQEEKTNSTPVPDQVRRAALTAQIVHNEAVKTVYETDLPVQHYYVGRSGPHEQGGVGESVAKIIEAYARGEKDLDLSLLPKHEIYLNNH